MHPFVLANLSLISCSILLSIGIHIVNVPCDELAQVSPQDRTVYWYCVFPFCMPNAQREKHMFGLLFQSTDYIGLTKFFQAWNYAIHFGPFSALLVFSIISAGLSIHFLHTFLAPKLRQQHTQIAKPLQDTHS
jgi:hypothetical protein